MKTLLSHSLRAVRTRPVILMILVLAAIISPRVDAEYADVVLNRISEANDHAGCRHVGRSPLESHCSISKSSGLAHGPYRWESFSPMALQALRVSPPRREDRQGNEIGLLFGPGFIDS